MKKNLRDNETKKPKSVVERFSKPNPKPKHHDHETKKPKIMMKRASKQKRILVMKPCLVKENDCHHSYTRLGLKSGDRSVLPIGRDYINQFGTNKTITPDAEMILKTFVTLYTGSVLIAGLEETDPNEYPRVLKNIAQTLKRT